MIETLILGIAIGVLSTFAVAAYAAYRWDKQPFVLKKFNSGYRLIAADLGVDGDPSGYVGLKKIINLLQVLNLTITV